MWKWKINLCLVACRLKPYESDSDDEDYNVDFEDETKLPPIEIPPGDHKLQVSKPY